MKKATKRVLNQKQSLRKQRDAIPRALDLARFVVILSLRDARRRA
jgi:hypothetical protein